MPLNKETVFLVKTYVEPIVVKINGRASYLNSAPVSDFFARMIAGGKKSFVVDFKDCHDLLCEPSPLLRLCATVHGG